MKVACFAFVAIALLSLTHLSVMAIPPLAHPNRRLDPSRVLQAGHMHQASLEESHTATTMQSAGIQFADSEQPTPAEPLTDEHFAPLPNPQAPGVNPTGPGKEAAFPRANAPTVPILIAPERSADPNARPAPVIRIPFPIQPQQPPASIETTLQPGATPTSPLPTTALPTTALPTHTNTPIATSSAGHGRVARSPSSAPLPDVTYATPDSTQPPRPSRSIRVPVPGQSATEQSLAVENPYTQAASNQVRPTPIPQAGSPANQTQMPTARFNDRLPNMPTEQAFTGPLSQAPLGVAMQDGPPQESVLKITPQTASDFPLAGAPSAPSASAPTVEEPTNGNPKVELKLASPQLDTTSLQHQNPNDGPREPFRTAQAPDASAAQESLPPPSHLRDLSPPTEVLGQETGQVPRESYGSTPFETLDPVFSGEAMHCSNSCENAVFDSRVFVPNPDYQFQQYDPHRELGVYQGKTCIPAQAPWVETWRGLYRSGPLPPANTFLTGETNPIIPHFLVFGDYRTAVAINDNGSDEFGVWAHRLNLDFDLKITSTERIHAFWGPLDNDGRFTRAEFRDSNIELRDELDEDFDTLYFEGDAGYIWGGMTDQWAPFDLPFVAGKYPLLFQNGIWMVDAIEGFAFTFPGKHSRILDWSNFEATFFFGFDDIDSPAFAGDDNAADVYGTNWFIEAYGGYIEAGYAYLDDTTGQGRSYHNIGLAYTRRYFHRVSNSVRLIINAGQDPVAGAQTADGQLLLIENSLITSNPSNFIPYFNMFAGFDRPQSVARAGGILLNTGINFESDGLTGYPTLDATANDTWGGALGINLLGPDFSWQLVTELAMVQTFGNGGQRQAVDDQYAVGARFQVPITNAWIFRLDGMYGLLEDAPDISGARAELRWKF